ADEDPHRIKQRYIFHSTTNPLAHERGLYGDIADAKIWCGFENPRGSTALYRKWREELKAYITQRCWDPVNLTETQLVSVLNFARSLPPISSRLRELKTSFRKSAVAEFERHMRIFVKDLAKKLQTTFERRNADTESAGVGEGGRGTHSVHINSAIIVLKYYLS